MNNKKLGTAFERMMCRHLSQDGWWVHFMSPDARGAQPFDIIAVRNDISIVIDCKTCKDHIFRISRLEDNQIAAFDLWKRRGNLYAYIAVLHDDKVFMIEYEELIENKKIDLDVMEAYINGVSL